MLAIKKKEIILVTMNLKSTSEICCLCVWHAFRFVNVLYSKNQFKKKSVTNIWRVRILLLHTPWWFLNILKTDIVHISSLLFTCSMFRLYCLHVYCLQYTCFHAFCLHVYVLKWLPAYRGSSDHHRVHYVHRRLVVLRIKRKGLPGFKNIYRWWDYRLAFTLRLEL